MVEFLLPVLFLFGKLPRNKLINWCWIVITIIVRKKPSWLTEQEWKPPLSFCSSFPPAVSQTCFKLSSSTGPKPLLRFSSSSSSPLLSASCGLVCCCFPQVWKKTPKHFVFKSGNVGVYLHSEQGSEMRSRVFTGDTCGDAHWCQVGTCLELSTCHWITQDGFSNQVGTGPPFTLEEAERKTWREVKKHVWSEIVVDLSSHPSSL